MAVSGVCTVEHSVGVGVQVSQRFEAIGCQLAGARAVVQHGRVAKELAPGVDQPVAIAVQHHNTVVGPDPAGAGLGAVAVHVK